MRTFEEIIADFDLAVRAQNVEALLVSADELRDHGTPTAQAISSQAIGIANHIQGNLTAALEHLGHALGLMEELADSAGAGRIIGNLGVVHMSAGDHPAALEHFHRALHLYEEHGDRESAARVTSHIGNIMWFACDYPTALEYHLRALAVFEELGNKQAIADVNSRIGNVYYRTDDLPMALEYYGRAGAYYKEVADPRLMANTDLSVGNVFCNTREFPKALEHFSRALAVHEEYGNESGIALSLVNSIGVLLEMESDAEASKLLQRLDTIEVDSPDVKVCREMYRAKLQENEGQIDEAIATLKHALNESTRYGLRLESSDVHRVLRDIAQKRNDFPAYIEHNNEFTRITEEINGKDTATKLAMQAKQREIDAERIETQKHLAVLHSTLPKHIADRVARGETVNDAYDDAVVLFLDVVGFTNNSSELPANEVVELLQNIFTTFDAICAEHNVMKIKTIGDSYMAVAFPSDSYIDNAAGLAPVKS